MPRGDCIVENPEILTKLEQAFAIGCTDEEACVVAGISKGTLYGYIDQHPGFHERKEELKQLQKVKAKHNIALALKDKDINTSKWYLEHRSEQFKPPSQAKLTLNQFNILTDTQLKDRLANKLNKFLGNTGE